MIFPLEDLSKYKGGMYAITVAASRRAYQLAKLAKYNDSLVQEELEEAKQKKLWYRFTKWIKGLNKTLIGEATGA